MMDAIFIGMSGLVGYSDGLRVISNNAANLNTPGFKSATPLFGDLFSADAGASSGTLESPGGMGLDSFGSRMNFSAGQLQQTNDPLDLGISGEGFFTLRNAEGELRYTRAGQFHFDAEGILVNTTDNSKVVSVDENGVLGTFTLNGFRTHSGKASEVVPLHGNVANDTPTGSQQPGEDDHSTSSLPNVVVYDDVGVQHTLSIKFTNLERLVNGNILDKDWFEVELKEGTRVIGTERFLLVGDKPSQTSFKFEYSPLGRGNQPLTIDISDVTFHGSSPNETALTQGIQDGYMPGNLTTTAFDDKGTLVFTYSNGQTTKGPQIALARFDTLENVEATGDTQFRAKDGRQWNIAAAGEPGYGSIRASVVEGSNVNLSQEFSNLVIMQRGYQASSQVISTASEMLQQLFTMSGSRG